MKIQETAENYFETILMLEREKGYVRSVDLANRMGLTKPTISYTMKQFRENGYIAMDADGHIVLLKEARDIAQTMLERHEIIAKILIALGVQKETAYADACKIEHDLSEESFLCMKRHYEKNRQQKDT